MNIGDFVICDITIPQPTVGFLGSSIWVECPVVLCIKYTNEGKHTIQPVHMKVNMGAYKDDELIKLYNYES